MKDKYLAPVTFKVSSNKVKHYCLKFTNPASSEVIGILDVIDGVLTFEGNVDESARIFFDHITKMYNA